MGHDEVGCETRGGVLLNNVRLDRWRRTRIGAWLAGSRRAPALATGNLATAEDVVRSAVGALTVLAAGTSALVLPVLLRGAVLDAPTLRPALEMMLTLFSLSAAWLLRAQFVASRRSRDLLLVCATLGLGLMTLCVNALPTALDAPDGAFLAAAGLYGQLVVAAIFAAAAAVPADMVVPPPNQPTRVGLLLGVAPLLGATLGGLLMSAFGLDLSAHVGAAGEAVVIVLVLGSIALLVYAATVLASENFRRPDHAAGAAGDRGASVGGRRSMPSDDELVAQPRRRDRNRDAGPVRRARSSAPRSRSNGACERGRRGPRRWPSAAVWPATCTTGSPRTWRSSRRMARRSRLKWARSIPW